MTPFELSTGSYLGVEVPDGAWRFYSNKGIIEGRFGMDVCVKPTPGSMILSGHKVDLPPGQYSLIGENPLQLSEMECREVVERSKWGDAGYKDYQETPRPHSFYSATESYQSLLTSLGLKEPFVILKKKCKE